MSSGASGSMVLHARTSAPSEWQRESTRRNALRPAKEQRMLPDLDLVSVSRLQFAATAMYHFLFVPLTLGLSWILVICESVYVMSGRQIYRDMTRFWGLLFGINFVMGVTTGLTLEFQFGTNWAYYAHYVGDVFSGWSRLGKIEHLMVTFLVALGSNLSALWILIANGWMQNPVGAEFNYET